jgi:hypothetical protein
MQIKYSDIGSTEPITSAEVKAWLKVDFSDEDTLISSLITQVREIAEEAAGRAFIDKTIEYFEGDYKSISNWTNPAYPYDMRWIKLPYPNHDSITEVKLHGTVTTDYTKRGLTQFEILLNTVYPSTEDDSGLYVKYTTLNECPEGVKLAMMKCIAETYEHRKNTFEGSLVKLTDDFYGYISQFKVY